MSISVDESGIPTPRNLTEAIAGLRRAADNSGVHPAYKRALRDGAPGTRHNITIGGHPVTIIVAQQPHHPANPAREHASWIELREAVTGLLGTASGHHVAAMLPAEVAAAIWQHEGREVRAYHPGAASTLRRARSGIRRRLGALFPLPLLGTLTQPLTGSATAVGIALAPVVPPMHTTPPPAPVVRELTGEIARPELPYIPGLHLTAPPVTTLAPMTPEPPDEATASDTNPRPTVDPTPQTAAPATPAAPVPEVSVTPTPTVDPAPESTTTTSPPPAPAPTEQPSTGAPLDAPEAPAAEPGPAAQTSPSSTHTPRGHGYRHRHGKHQQRPSHRRH